MKKTVMTICVLLLLAGCAPQETSDKLQIVTTIGQIADIAQNVAGDKAEVTGLMGSGVDPHLYQASESDVRKLSNADVIFYNGLHLEAQMGEVFAKMQETKKVVALADQLPKENLLADPEYEGQHDPHVWFDVTLWTEVVSAVADTLVEADPANAETYQANAAAYKEKLDALHQYVTDEASKVPESARVLITAHDAFNYFGEAYGFEVKGLQGLSTEAEAGTRDVQDLAQFIVDREIKAIFIESSIPERNVRAVQEAVRAKDWEVTIGGELFSDAMGAAGTEEGTYIGMFTHNIDTIVTALQ